MKIWAIADLHLAISVPEKSMECFGPAWSRYMERIKSNWEAVVAAEDLVLIPGDISWAMKLEQAIEDLKWIDALPGTKLLLRGNHDYWWASASKVRKALPPSIHIIHNDAFAWHDYSIGGTRLWDTKEYAILDAQRVLTDEHEKIYERELNRLELSLKAMKTERRIAMTHYPPLGSDLKPSRASKLLEQYNVTHCLFGHLHNLPPGKYFGMCGKVEYILVAGDYLKFEPYRLV